MKTFRIQLRHSWPLDHLWNSGPSETVKQKYLVHYSRNGRFGRYKGRLNQMANGHQWAASRWNDNIFAFPNRGIAGVIKATTWTVTQSICSQCTNYEAHPISHCCSDASILGWPVNYGNTVHPGTAMNCRIYDEYFPGHYVATDSSRMLSLFSLITATLLNYSRKVSR